MTDIYSNVINDTIIVVKKIEKFSIYPFTNSNKIRDNIYKNESENSTWMSIGKYNGKYG